jgi:HSP20 family protein
MMEVPKMATLVRWDPAVEVDSLQSEVNRLFDSFFSGRGGDGGATRRWVPAMDLAETEEELVLTADLPGLSEEDVAIEIKDGVLTVSGERRESREDKGKGYHRVERSTGRFSRSLAMPDGVDADRVQASFDRGVLEVRIPKPEERKPHRVSIGSSRTLEGGGTEK